MANSQTQSSIVVAGGNYSPSRTDSDYNDSGSDNDITNVTLRVVFAVILACGLIANCALVIYIVRGQRRIGSREPPQLNLFVLAVHAAANIVNSLSNGIWIIYTVTGDRSSDVYQTLGCSFDAAAVQIIVVIHAVGLALMSVDRLTSVRNVDVALEQRGFTLTVAALLIAVGWLCSIGLSVPLVVPNGVDIEGNSQRFLCTVHSEAPPAYVWTIMVIAYICPISVVVAMFIGTAVLVAVHRRKLLSSQTYATSSTGTGAPATETGPIPAAGGHRHDPAAALIVEVNAAKYVICLFVAWFVFVLPFPILSLVRIGRTASLPSRSRPFSYDKAMDAIMTCLFISYPLLLPGITYIWRKNICSRCIHRLRTCCRESVSAAEASSSGQSPSVKPKCRQRVGDVHPSNISPGRRGGIETGSSAGHRSVPVLFATSHGLHIRSSSAPNGLPDPAAAADRQVKSGEDRKSGGEARECDVFGSVAALQNQDLLNTSDYDSGEEDGGAGNLGQSVSHLERSVESRGPPQSTSVQDADHSTTSKSVRRSLSEKVSCVSYDIGDQPAGIPTGYDEANQETPVDSRVDHLIDSGVGTLKRCSGKTVEETSEVCPRDAIQDQQPESAVRATPVSTTEPMQTEGLSNPKKKLKNENRRNSRRVADVEMSDYSRKDVGNERQKSAKATSKTQNRRTEHSSTWTPAHPQRRDLPKIVINGKAEGEDDAGDAAGTRHVVHSNTDPNISTSVATLNVRTKAAAGDSAAGGDSDETAIRNPKADSGSSSRPQTVRRPLPPIGKRRRTASDSSAAAFLPGAS